MPTQVEVLEVDGGASVVPQVRRWVRSRLSGADPMGVLDDVELVVTELVSNTVLHAPGPVEITLGRSECGNLRVEVTDTWPTVPERRSVASGGTTGRGLNLVEALSDSWGVGPRADGRTGKTVWCEFGQGRDAAQQTALDEPRELDLDAVLAAFVDPADAEPDLLDVDLGDAPTALVLAATDHLDGMLRELALAGPSSGLPGQVLDSITKAVARFALARNQLRTQLSRAEGADRVQLRFRLPVDLADAGEDYLAALAAADAFAQDRRLLSLESPVTFRVLRRWYVGGLVQGLREGAHAPRETFEQRLVVELQDLDERHRASVLAANLQRVTARLASAMTLDDIARAAVDEGARALGAAGGSLTRSVDGRTAVVLEIGVDAGMAQRYLDDVDLRSGPSTAVLTSGRPLYVEGPAERDAAFPHLRRLQPGVLSLAATPMLVAGEVVGALRFSFTSPHVFAASERDYLVGVASLVGQAVARTDVLELLRKAGVRTRLLAQLGERLASDDTVAGVLDAVAEAVLPALGDWLAIHLLDDQSRVTCELARHRDPELSRALQELFARLPVTPKQPYGAGAALASGVTQRLPEITLDMVEAVAAGDEGFSSLMRRVDLRSGVCVPLLARGRVLGVLSLARSSAYPLLDADIDVVEDIGRRSGTALDNVRALTTAVRLELALDAASMGSYELHLRTGRLTWDERLFAMLEVDPATFDGTLGAFMERVLPEDAARTERAIARAVETVGELDVNYRVRLRDGSLRWLEGRGRVLRGADGAAERLVGVAVDVTEQHGAGDRALRSLDLMADGFLQLAPDWTVSWVNSAAARLTGRSRDEVVGKIFWEVFPQLVGSAVEMRYREAARTGESVRFEGPFGPGGADLEVRAYPSPQGLSLYVGDLRLRRSTERERDRAVQRLSMLNEVGSALTETLDVDVALTRLAELMVPTLADLVSLDVRDEDDVRGVRAVVITGSDPRRAQALRVADERLPRRHNPATAVYKVLAGDAFQRLTVDPGYLTGVAVDARQLASYVTIDTRHALVVPLAARGRVFGALSLLRCGPDATPYTDDEVTLALDIGRRAGLIVDNTAQYTEQRAVAEGLQRSLLPQLLDPPGLQLGAAYSPSSSSAKVGGDWYDAFGLPDGALGIVIGDVMGHDIAAAAAMGQLRSVLRTCAADGDAPGVVLDRLDRLVLSFSMADLATVVYAQLARRPDGSGELTWSNAGHPPPLLLAPGEPPRFLTAGGSTMIGVQIGVPRTSATEVLPRGSTVLMFTDGLVERRGTDLDERLELLRCTAQKLLAGTDHPGLLCNRLLAAAAREGLMDDAAAIAVTLR